MEAQIASVIEGNDLDFFRLDYNTHGCGRIETAVIAPGAPNQNSQLITVSLDPPIQAWKNPADAEWILSMAG